MRSRKSLWLIPILIIVLLATNLLWLSLVVSRGFEYNNLEHELARTNRALYASTQLMTLIRPSAKDSTIISEAKRFSIGGEIIRKNGCVKVGDLAFRFDEEGTLLDATRAWRLPESDPCLLFKIPDDK